MKHYWRLCCIPPCIRFDRQPEFSHAAFDRNRWFWTALSNICAAYFWLHFLKHRGGAELYQHAAQCLWDHQVIQVCDKEFTYPPFFAFVMLPSIAMPTWLMLAVWFTVTVACAIWCCALAEQIVVFTFAGFWSERDRKFLRLIAIFVSLKFILAVFENQGFDLLALPALLLGILASTRKRECTAMQSTGPLCCWSIWAR